MLPNSCFWNVWNVHFAVVIRTSSVLIFPNIAKKDFSWQIITSLYREHFWNTFQAKETPCCTPVLREGEAVHGCPCHSDRRSWFGTEARVVFLSQEALGMEFIQGGECMKQTGFFQSLNYWGFCGGDSAQFVRSSPGLFFPACANKAWSCPICYLLKGDHV